MLLQENPRDLLDQVPQKMANILNHQERRSKCQANRLVNTLVGVSKDMDYLLPVCTLKYYDTLHL